jgi:hypothetical protein
LIDLIMSPLLKVPRRDEDDKKAALLEGGSRFVQEVGGTRNEIDRRPQASSLLSFALSTTIVCLNMAAIIIAFELKVNRRFDQRAECFTRYPCIAHPSGLW